MFCRTSCTGNADEGGGFLCIKDMETGYKVKPLFFYYQPTQQDPMEYIPTLKLGNLWLKQRKLWGRVTVKHSFDQVSRRRATECCEGA